MKIAILVSVIGGGFGIYVYLDWTYNFTGPQHSNLQVIQLVMMSSNHVAIYNFTLGKFRERVDVTIDADQLVSAYMLDEENFGYYSYCQISIYCPSVNAITSFEYSKQGSLEVTQKRWQASTTSESGFHLIIVGPDMATTHVNVTIVEYHW